MTRSFGYDAAGNTLSDTGLAFTTTYRLDNRMGSLTKGGATWYYSYDAGGQRIRKNNGSTYVHFAYDQDGQLLGEYGLTAPNQEYVWLGGLPIAVLNGAAADPQVLHVYADHLGAPRVLVDKNDALRWRWISEPFGTTAPEENPGSLGTVAFNLRFPGQFADRESGLSYNYFRDYDGTTGRYVQSDPIGLGGGINTYAYVGGNPLRYSDPLGLRPITQTELYALKAHFGSCLDSILEKLDINVRTIGDTSRAVSLDNGFISFPRNMFLDGNPNNSLDLSTPYNVSIFGHELLHQLQRLNGVNVTAQALLLQIKYSFGTDVYSYPASTDPAKMLATFRSGNVEQQGQMFQDYLRAYDSGANSSAFELIAKLVKSDCTCEK